MKETITLTTRQMDVLVCASRGITNKGIAKILFISPSTVKAHMSEVLKKFGVKSRIQAIIIAKDKGLIPPQDSEQP